MEFTSSNIIYLITWFILPVIPAVICFKLMTSRAVAEGPFRRLQINLGGAFAGYFLLFIILIPLMFRLVILKDSIYEVWTIKGKIMDPTNNKIGPSANPILTLVPSTEVKNGEFCVDVIAKRLENGQIQFPVIAVGADNYVSDNLESLDYLADEKHAVKKNNWQMDCLHRIAVLKTGVVLKPDMKISPELTTSNANLYVQSAK